VDHRTTNTAIYGRIGFLGLFNVVWNSTPIVLKPFTLPYGLWVYHSLMIQSQTLLQLQNLHGVMCEKSFLYRLLRPRFRKAQKVLRNYDLS